MSRASRLSGTGRLAWGDLLLAALAVAVAAVAMNAGPYLGFLSDMLAGRLVYDDSFQYIPPYMRGADGSPRFDDQISAYFRHAHAPQGFDLLYDFLGRHLDIRLAATLIGLGLFAVMIVFVFLTGRIVAGLPGAFCAVFIVLASEHIAVSVFSGLPRSFARPLMAMALYGMASGRTGFAAAATILGALFFYQAAILTGVSLGLYCLFDVVRRDGGRDRLVRHAVLLAVTGAVSLGLIGLSVTRDHPFGGMIGPAQYQAYPEAGPGGRLYASFDDPVRKAVTEIARTFTRETADKQSLSGEAAAPTAMTRFFEALSDHKAELGLLGGALFLAGLALFPTATLTAPLILAAGSVGLYLLAWAVFPLMFFPGRFFYSLPVITVLLAAWFLVGAVRRLGGDMPVIRQTALVLLVASALFLATGRPQWRGSIPDATAQSVYDFIQTLPEDALVAGWPGDMPFIDAIPYRGERQILVSYETHQVFRQGYVEMMRDRLQVLLDALVAGDPDAVAALRRRFGVTHLVGDTRLTGDQRLRYFPPFRAQLDAIPDHGAGMRLLASGAAGPTIFARPPYFIVDITAIVPENQEVSP